MKIKKGTALIVGTDKGDYIETDGIVIYAAYSLSKGQPQLIDNAILSNEDVYICGHSSNKGTIDGRTMEDIAEALVNKCGYRGKQRIHIMACHSKDDNKEKDLGDLLRIELGKLLTEEVEVIAEVYNTSIIVDKNMKTTEFYDIKTNPFFGNIQKRFLKKQNLYGIKLEKNNYKEILKKIQNTSMSAVDRYNKSLTKRGDNVVDELKRYLAVSIGLLLSLFLLVPIYARVWDIKIHYIYIIFAMIGTLLINKYRKKKEIIWKTHLITLCATVILIMSKIAKVIFAKTDYSLVTLGVTIVICGVMCVGVFCLGLYITDKYYD